MLGAYIIDAIILFIFSFCIMFGIGYLFKISETSMDYKETKMGLDIFILVLYHSLFEASKSQGSWGKQILDLKVTDLEGDRIEMGTAFTRSLVKVSLSFVILGGLFAFGMPPEPAPGVMPDFSHPYYILTFSVLILFLVFYLMAAFTARKQALHDMIAGTVVLKKYSEEKEW